MAVLPGTGGTSKSGKAWKKREYILETPGQYPKKICFQLFNDKVDQYPMRAGQEVKVGVDIESREYNGRWYTQISAYKVEVLGEQTNAAPQYQQPADPYAAMGMPQQQVYATPPQADDLPF